MYRIILWNYQLTLNIKIYKSQMQNLKKGLKVLHFTRCKHSYKISQVLQNNTIKRNNMSQKDKLGLKEVLNIDGRYSYSKVSKILAKIGEKKAQEIGLIPIIHSKNGKKRIFKMEEVKKWMEK
mgnify:FL=1